MWGAYYSTWYQAVAYCKAYGGRLPSLADLGYVRQEDGSLVCSENAACNKQSCIITDNETQCRFDYQLRTGVRNTNYWKSTRGTSSPTRVCCLVE